MDKDLRDSVEKLARGTRLADEEALHAENVSQAIEIHEEIEEKERYIIKLKKQIKTYRGISLVGLFILICILLYACSIAPLTETSTSYRVNKQISSSKPTGTPPPTIEIDSKPVPVVTKQHEVAYFYLEQPTGITVDDLQTFTLQELVDKVEATEEGFNSQLWVEYPFSAIYFSDMPNEGVTADTKYITYESLAEEISSRNVEYSIHDTDLSFEYINPYNTPIDAGLYTKYPEDSSGDVVEMYSLYTKESLEKEVEALGGIDKVGTGCFQILMYIGFNEPFDKEEVNQAILGYLESQTYEVNGSEIRVKDYLLFLTDGSTEENIEEDIIGIVKELYPTARILESKEDSAFWYELFIQNTCHNTSIYALENGLY